MSRVVPYGISRVTPMPMVYEVVPDTVQVEEDHVPPAPVHHAESTMVVVVACAAGTTAKSAARAKITRISNTVNSERSILLFEGGNFRRNHDAASF